MLYPLWGWGVFLSQAKDISINEDTPVVEDPATHHREIALFVVRMEKALYCQFQTLLG